MAFPVTLNGTTYTLANFSGLSYVQGFPDALEDFVTEAGTKVTAAATSATAAATSATASATSATAAASSATAAAASATSAQASLDAIEGFYLGAQSSDPSADLNGAALTAGDWYFNTGSSALKVYDGSSFVTFSALTFDFVSDTTPQLGGDLDFQSFKATSFASTGIDDNANALAMTINSDEDISVGSTANHSSARIVINRTPPTAFGSPMLQVGQETFVGNGVYSVGLGYTGSGYTEPPAEIAAVSTSSSGGTTADIIFGTRTVTTNTAVTERMRIISTGVVQFENGISEKYNAVTSSSNATTVNLQDGTNFSHTLSENTTFTFSNPASSGRVSGFTLKVVQDSSASGFTITWPTSVDWPSGTAPTLTATASAVDYFVFITHDGGTNYYGFTAGQALA